MFYYNPILYDTDTTHSKTYNINQLPLLNSTIKRNNPTLHAMFTCYTNDWSSPLFCDAINNFFQAKHYGEMYGWPQVTYNI